MCTTITYKSDLGESSLEKDCCIADCSYINLTRNSHQIQDYLLGK